MTKQRRTQFVCPVDVALSLIAGKWKPMILWLLTGKRRRFSEFQAAMPRLAHKVLSQQLRQLDELRVERLRGAQDVCIGARAHTSADQSEQ